MKSDASVRQLKRRLMITGGGLFAVVLVSAVVLFLFPIRTWLDQRSDVGREQDRLELLRRENAKLSEEAAKLQTDAEVERIARERFGLVRPGEQAFAILPAPTSTAPSTTALPPSSSTVAPATTVR